eukprot:GEZU01038752.1.p2 GENE.GEZU01038752.1~~GEZU01038752.1.p2  ORF type:complete len:124 (+),score=17.62 GEZU01038752.1:99-470(+)
MAMKFCAECNNMLYPRENKEKKVMEFRCKNCNHTEGRPENDEDNSEFNKVYTNTITKVSFDEKTQVPYDITKDPTLPRSRSVRCPHCQNNEAVYFQSTNVDARAESAMTLYFVCCNCGNVWSD